MTYRVKGKQEKKKENERKMVQTVTRNVSEENENKHHLDG